MFLNCASSATEVIVVVMRIQGGGRVYVMESFEGWPVQTNLFGIQVFGRALPGISMILGQTAQDGATGLSEAGRISSASGSPLIDPVRTSRLFDLS